MTGIDRGLCIESEEGSRWRRHGTLTFDLSLCDYEYALLLLKPVVFYNRGTNKDTTSNLPCHFLLNLFHSGLVHQLSSKCLSKGIYKIWYSISHILSLKFTSHWTSRIPTLSLFFCFNDHDSQSSFFIFLTYWFIEEFLAPRMYWLCFVPLPPTSTPCYHCLIWSLWTYCLTPSK